MPYDISKHNGLLIDNNEQKIEILAHNSPIKGEFVYKNPTEIPQSHTSMQSTHPYSHLMNDTPLPTPANWILGPEVTSIPRIINSALDDPIGTDHPDSVRMLLASTTAYRLPPLLDASGAPYEHGVLLNASLV